MVDFNQPTQPPQLNQVATVTTSDGAFTYWTSIMFERVYTEPISHMTLECAEPGQNIPGWSNQQLAVMQPAIGALAGQLVINGRVDVRQVAYEKGTHSVQIRVASETMNAYASTCDPDTDGNGGEFKDQTFLQIAQAVMAKCDVTVKLAGNPTGANDSYSETVREQNGERRIDFVNRIAAMKGLFAVDNADGALVYGRPGDDPQASGLVLEEGKNILAARATMQANLQVGQINAKAQHPATDPDNGPTASQVLATAYNRNYNGPPRPFVLMVEETASVNELQLRANHEMSLINLQQFDVTVTVQGWQTPSGSLWSNFLGQAVSLTSPMIIPIGRVFTTLLIKGVKHLQDSEGGTRTELNLCLPQGLGNGGEQINPTPLGISTNSASTLPSVPLAT